MLPVFQVSLLTQLQLESKKFLIPFDPEQNCHQIYLENSHKIKGPLANFSYHRFVPYDDQNLCAQRSSRRRAAGRASA